MSLQVKDILAQAIEKLKDSQISEPELSVKYLFQHVLKLSNIEFQLSLNSNISESQNEKFQSLIDQRLEQVPVQYLIESVEFYNTTLKVDKRVLIPRPETEELVDQLLKLIRDRAGLKILDIGTGSGNIAIALAANLIDPEITALDISQDALKLAKENASANRLNTIISFVHGDVFNEKFWENFNSFDVIVSNPPYVDSTEYKTLQPEVKLYEPRIALVSESDVLAFFKEIARRASTKLNKNGILCYEIGMGQEKQVEQIIKGSIPDSTIEIKNDLNGIPRIVIVIRN